MARLTEARLSRELAEGKVIDFRRTETGFEVIRISAITDTKHKVRDLSRLLDILTDG